MKKLIVYSSVAVLMLSTLNVYAGPKFKKIKNPKLGARVSRVTAETLRKGGLRYAPEHTPRLSERAEHTTTAPSSTVQRPNLRDVQDGTISPRLPSGGNVQGVHVGTFRSTPELPYRNPADIPTRVQAAKMLEDAKLRSEQKGDPNILVAQEVEVSFARYKREQLSEKLNSKVQELRSQDKSASSEEISKHYDELRAQEMKRYSDVKRDILERYIVKEEIKAYDELDRELNIHLDALDRINEEEIVQRTQQQFSNAKQTTKGQVTQGLKAAEESQALVRDVLPQLGEGEIIHSVGLTDELLDVVYLKDLKVDLSEEGLNDLAVVLEKARQENPHATFLIVQTHQPTEVFAKEKPSVEAVREKRNIIEYLFDLEDNSLIVRGEDVPELGEGQVRFLLDQAR